MALPPPQQDQAYVTISPFAAGHITLPEYIFYAPSDPSTKVLVPSLSFLVTHPGASLLGRAGSKKRFRMLFDLGVRAEPSRYVPVLQRHIKSRSPIHHRPSALDTLRTGGIEAGDVDAIAISHVHWDHHGDPEDFPASTFLLGPGAKRVLSHGLPGTGNHSVFDPDLYAGKKVLELGPLPGVAELKGRRDADSGCCNSHPSNDGVDNNDAADEAKAVSAWRPLGPFPHTLDLLGDGSVYVVSAPGHLPGHINLLCRTSPTKWVYLGGDTFHDRRMLTGEKRIATYPDESGSGRTCCIHVDKEAAQRSLERVAELVQAAARSEGAYEVETIVAHDVVWWRENRARLFPNVL